MGAQIFVVDRTVSKDTTTANVFEDCRVTAQLEEGSGGYTGTIAEKRGFAMVPVAITSAAELKAFLANTLYAYEDTPTPYDEAFIDMIGDKWKPAWCARFPLSDTQDSVVFFGNASS